VAVVLQVAQRKNGPLQHLRAARQSFVLLVAFVASFASPAANAGITDKGPQSLDCATMPCQALLPQAQTFEPLKHPSNRAYAQGRNAAGEVVGWVALSTEVLDVRAYSGKPLITLFAIDTQGVITGAQVLHHSEPILLVGIPEQKLHDFVKAYAGHSVREDIVVGQARDPNTVALDVISGATVTVLAQNRTVMDGTRRLARDVGVLEPVKVRDGSFVVDAAPWPWQRMVDEGALAHLVVPAQALGGKEQDGPMLDLWFGLIDPPAFGQSLLAAGDYRWLRSKLEPHEHLLFVAANGTTSFKGSGFVRGGIFDRIRLQQGLESWMFHDHDYLNVARVEALGAPTFKEAAVFIVRGGGLDPGLPMSFHFIGSVYDQKGGFSRSFESFAAQLSLSTDIYVAQGEAPHAMSGEASLVAQAWYNQRGRLAGLSIFLGLVGLAFVGRRWLTADMKRLKRLHLLSLCTALGLGFGLQVQPSVTQILTLIDTLIKRENFGLFLLEPTLFVAWIFIFVVSLIWGRGVFCGWVCPYGALTELAHKLAHRLGLRPRELPEKWHRIARWGRYGVLFGLVALYLWSPPLGEQSAEIEPFKTTFFVAPWHRQWYFIVWWSALLLASLWIWRPFCRYLCPLGGALAIFSSFRRSGPYRRNFCTSCKICTKGCEPLAIRENGTIDPRECLSCMECEATFRDESTCPPLVGIDRLTRKLGKDTSELAANEHYRKLLHEVQKK
jgi:NosR/NirI family nitrous oxide reductase transcriptional regulator